MEHYSFCRLSEPSPSLIGWPLIHPARAEKGIPMQAFLLIFLEQHVKQLSIAREMAGTIRKYFPPLYAYPLAEITPLIVEAWVHHIPSHSQANKSLSILRTCFEKARDWRLFTGDNPAQRVKKYPKHARTRFVQPLEMPALMAALRREREDIQCFFLLCLLVGCRRGEALTLRWVDLDAQGGVWHKPRTKTGIPHTVPIPLALLTRLLALPHTNEFVFATKAGHWCCTLAFDRWAVIRTAAGLGDVTIHDLRRTCASWLACSGENMAVIGRGVLNHTSLSHTGIYARLNVTPVSRALEANSVRMLGSALTIG
jgi:integrase